MSVFVKAGPAEILRAAQKDESVIKTIQKMLEEVVFTLGGPRFSMKYKNQIIGLSNLFYYFNTSMCGLQTLGEEYTGIVQVDSSLKTMPHLFNRFVMVIMESFGLVISMKLCKLAQHCISKDSELLPEVKEKLLKYLEILLKLLPHIDNFHKAFFFCNWGTYQLSKRISGVHYILARFWLKDRKSLPAFRILGGITMLQLIVTASIQIHKLYVKQLNNPQTQPTIFVKSVESEKSKKCAMCLSSLDHPTCTQCGHIFCWNCILEWLQSETQCPICREPIEPSRLVPLQNFN